MQIALCFLHNAIYIIGQFLCACWRDSSDFFQKYPYYSSDFFQIFCKSLDY